MIGVRPAAPDEILTGGAFSSDSLDTLKLLLVLALCIWIAWSLGKRAIRFFGFLLGFLFVLQMGFLLAQTSLNDLIPLDAVFCIDVFTVLSDVFGPPVSTFLIRLNQMMEELIATICSFF